MSQSSSWLRSGGTNQTPLLMKMGLLTIATLPLPERAIVKLPTLMVLGQNHMPLLMWPAQCQTPLPMKTGLLAIAILPFPEPAMVILPTLMRLGQCQTPLPKRLRQDASSARLRPAQNQLSSRLWPSPFQSPLLMKTGLLAMATLPLPE